MTIGLFYGSTTCYTEMAAEKICEQLGNDKVELHNIKDTPLSETANFEVLIFGISTWDFGELQEDWESHWEEIAELDLAGKVIALFGMGDQENYGEWFQDALGMLHHAIAPMGVTVIGFWPNSDDYEFIGSKALTADGTQFVGLALDDEGQYDLSEQRIAKWCEQILKEMEQLGVSA